MACPKNGAAESEMDAGPLRVISLACILHFLRPFPPDIFSIN